METARSASAPYLQKNDPRDIGKRSLANIPQAFAALRLLASPKPTA